MQNHYIFVLQFNTKAQTCYAARFYSRVVENSFMIFRTTYNNLPLKFSYPYCYLTKQFSRTSSCIIFMERTKMPTAHKYDANQFFQMNNNGASSTHAKKIKKPVR
jgi:hypothetical protein